MLPDPDEAFDYTPEVVVENPLSGQWLEFIRRAEGRPVLNLGSGNQPGTFDNLIKMDIFAVPNTEIVASAMKLPFKSASLHTVFSGAVFEHLRNPFQASDELFRVLEPNGEVYIETAFLSPVHAYPNQFFNMTTAGVEELFGNFDKINSGARSHQYPSFTLVWILNVWSQKLSPENHKDFVNSTVNEIKEEYNNNPFSMRWMEEFTEKDLQELACGVFFHGKKTAAVSAYLKFASPRIAVLEAQTGGWRAKGESLIRIYCNRYEWFRTVWKTIERGYQFIVEFPARWPVYLVQGKTLVKKIPFMKDLIKLIKTRSVQS